MQEFDEKMYDFYANPESYEGTSLTVTEYPNPVLRSVGAEISEFDDKLNTLCEEMFTVMYASQGVGLAAPQVGLSLQLFVYNTDPSAPMKKMREAVVINPKIVDYREVADLDSWTDVDIEGCLSSRAECCRGHIRRAKQIEVEYQDVRGCGPHARSDPQTPTRRPQPLFFSRVSPTRLTHFSHVGPPTIQLLSPPPRLPRLPRLRCRSVSATACPTPYAASCGKPSPPRAAGPTSARPASIRDWLCARTATRQTGPRRATVVPP